MPPPRSLTVTASHKNLSKEMPLVSVGDGRHGSRGDRVSMDEASRSREGDGWGLRGGAARMTRALERLRELVSQREWGPSLDAGHEHVCWSRRGGATCRRATHPQPGRLSYSIMAEWFLEMDLITVPP